MHTIQLVLDTHPTPIFFISYACYSITPSLFPSAPFLSHRIKKETKVGIMTFFTILLDLYLKLNSPDIVRQSGISLRSHSFLILSQLYSLPNSKS